MPCQDPNAKPDDSVCREYEARDVQPLFWRPLTLDDITNYAANARSYNQMLGRNQQKSVTTLTPHDLLLAQHVATVGPLPDDFIVLVGKYEGPDGCVSGVGAWYFSYKPREISHGRGADHQPFPASRELRRVARRENIRYSLAAGGQPV